MSRYNAKPIPADLEPRLRGYLSDELRRIGDVTSVASNVTLTTRAAAPDKLADGQLVYADGTNWDPGRGESFYARINGAWVDLALDATAAETISGEWVIGGVSASNLLDKSAAETITGSYKFTDAVAIDRGNGVYLAIWYRSGVQSGGIYQDSASQYWLNNSGNTVLANPISTKNLQTGGSLSVTTELLCHAGAGGTAVYLDSDDNETGAGLNLPALRWREADGTSVAGMRGYQNAGSSVQSLRLGTGWFSEKLVLSSDNAHSITGSLTISSNITLNSTAGTNTIKGSTFSVAPATLNVSPSGNMNIQPGGNVQILNGKPFRAFDSGTAGYADLFCSALTGNGYTTRLRNTGGGQFSIQEQGNLADDATATFDDPSSNYRGIAIIVTNYNQQTAAIIAYSGTAATGIWVGSGAVLGTSGSNPDVDGGLNIWTSSTGDISIKNRLGSTRHVTVYRFTTI